MGVLSPGRPVGCVLITALAAIIVLGGLLSPGHHGGAEVPAPGESAGVPGVQGFDAIGSPDMGARVRASLERGLEPVNVYPPLGGGSLPGSSQGGGSLPGSSQGGGSLPGSSQGGGSVPGSSLGGVVVIEDYPSFTFAYVSDEGRETLEDMGHRLVPVPGPGRTETQNFRWSVLEGPPVALNALPEHLSLDGVQGPTRAGGAGFGTPAPGSSCGSSFHLLHFAAPVRPGWREELDYAGVHLVHPVDRYTCVAELLPSFEGPGALPHFILGLAPYPPELRVAPGFAEAAPAPGAGKYPIPAVEGNGYGEKEPVTVNAVFFPGLPSATRHEHDAWLEEVGARTVEVEESAWFRTVKAEVPAGAIADLLTLEGLWYAEPCLEAKSRNDDIRWVLQSNDADARSTPVWDRGLHGEGIIIGCADTGIDYDHIMFRHNLTDQGVPGPDHRKLVSYNDSIHGWDDSSGHGTHVAGILAGDSAHFPGGYDMDDALAYGSRIAFYDIVKGNGAYAPPNVTALFDEAGSMGARSHSDSWGDDTTAYTTRSFRCDAYQWDHDDFLIFIAPGNWGPGPGTLLEPANAKNVVAVGNAVNGDSKSMAALSSNGPTEEGLFAPTMVAPGGSVRSASGDAAPGTYNEGYRSMTGTSMSAPAAASACALVEQYFLEGFYPTGAAEPGDAFVPSGPLRKAVLVNSAWDMKGGSYVDGPIPDSAQGWGKVLLDDALYFDGDDRDLWLMDGYNDTGGTPGLTAGRTDEYYTWANGSGPLEMTLCYNDYPGAGLINDLDLTVTAPDGSVYMGNDIDKGASVTGGAPDVNNTVECVLFKDPLDGMYVINVTASAVTTAEPQRYALVVTGLLTDTEYGRLNLDRAVYRPGTSVGLTLTDANLTGVQKAQVYLRSGTEASPEYLSLDRSGVPGRFQGSMPLALGAPAKDGVLQVSHGDRIEALYYDAYPEMVIKSSADVDARAPRVLNLSFDELTDTSVLVSWETDEPCTGDVILTEADGGGETVFEGAVDDLGSAHGLYTDDLSAGTAYFLTMVLEDALGNLGFLDDPADYPGGLRNFTTFDMVIRPGPAHMGYAVSDENGNRFAERAMRSGSIADASYRAALAFETSALPTGLAVTECELRLHGRSRARTAGEGGTWGAALLAGAAEEKFDGSYGLATESEPGGSLKHSDLGSGSRELVLEGQLWNKDLKAGRWNVWDLSAGERAALLASAADGLAAFVIQGPKPNGTRENVFSWDTGYDPDEDRRDTRLAPVLALRLDGVPAISPGAPTAVIMAEDGWDNSTLNTRDIFWDDGGFEALNISARGPGGAPLLNLTVTAFPDGGVNITPAPNWNGVEPIELTATDEAGSSAHLPMNVTVTAENDPVSWTNLTVRRSGKVLDLAGGGPTPVIDAVEDKWFRATAGLSDPDLLYEGDTYDLQVNDTGMKFNGTTPGLLEFLPGDHDVGYREVELRVTDSGGREDAVVVGVSVSNVNDPPVAATGGEALEAGEAVQGMEVILDAGDSRDPDIPHGDELTFTWRSDVEGSLGSGESLAYTFTQYGEQVITLKVEDLEGEDSRDERTLLVLRDTDGDGDPDRDDEDDDGDGLKDVWEEEWAFDPLDPSDAGADADNDTLTNAQEAGNGTNPRHHDSDTDGLPDSWELSYGLDPLDPSDAALDNDDDGMSNLEEYQAGTDPNRAEAEEAVGPGGGRALTLAVIGAIVVTVVLILLLLFIRIGGGGRRARVRKVAIRPAGDDGEPKEGEDDGARDKGGDEEKEEKEDVEKEEAEGKGKDGWEEEKKKVEKKKRTVKADEKKKVEMAEEKKKVEKKKRTVKADEKKKVEMADEEKKMEMADEKKKVEKKKRTVKADEKKKVEMADEEKKVEKVEGKGGEKRAPPPKRLDKEEGTRAIRRRKVKVSGASQTPKPIETGRKPSPGSKRSERQGPASSEKD